MAATDTQSLMAQAKCYICLGVTQFQALKLALLAQISNDMSTDVNTLMAQAKCYTCLGISIAEALELALLSNIVSGGGGGGSGANAIQPVPYSVSPPPNPPDVTKNAVAFDNSGGGLPTFWWSPTLQSWE